MTARRTASPVGAHLCLIGLVERVDLTRWGVHRLTAKVDTGAEGSALHVEELEPVGQTRVRFQVLEGSPRRRTGVRLVPVEARIARRGLVRSSNGKTEERIFVRTAIRLGGITQTAEVSLVDRSRMRYPMLIGCNILQGGRFLIDPTARYAASEED